MNLLSRRRALLVLGIGTLSIGIPVASNAIAQGLPDSTTTETPTTEPGLDSIPPSPQPSDNASTNRISKALNSTHLFWIMLLIIMGPLVTILSIFLGPFLWSDHLLEDRAKYLSTVMPKLLEGITILLIVSAVVLSGILEIDLPSGVLSLLAAIAGYVLGKSQSENRETLLTKEMEALKQDITTLKVAANIPIDSQATGTNNNSAPPVPLPE